MNKILFGSLIASFLFFGSGYYGSTTAPVTLVGGIIKSKHKDEGIIKYKRKDCPVCKGKGWYMSGDKIKRIECSYCEPEKGQVVAAPKAPGSDCVDGKCPIRKK